MMQQAQNGAQILRGFVSIREGQVHYRHGGPQAAVQGARPLWMIHASPASSITLVGMMREFGRSRPVFAPDTLGNGDSAPPGVAKPDIEYYADSSLRVMDALGLEKVDLYGSHTGAHIVTEMALARPDRFGRMILDGIAMFSSADKADFLANYAPAITPDSFGTQFHWAWHFVRDQGWFFPYFRRDAAHLRGIAPPSTDVMHDLTVEVLKSVRTYHHAYRAAFAHPDAERLPLVRLPTLVMADDSDPLKTGVDRAASLLPGARRWISQGLGTEEKVAVLARFLDSGEFDAA
jgi:pimeloyl-ACP methyl ester carboxylesterase